MSIDKFGRHSTRNYEGRTGPRGEGFNLTPLGDYDMKGKRLQNVEDPVQNADVVNLITLNSGLSNCIQLDSTRKYFDAQAKRINNAAEPIDLTDLATKGYVDKKTPFQNQEEKTYSFHQFVVKDIAFPKDDGDAVNLNYVKKNLLAKDAQNIFDAKGGSISGLRDPTKGAEAATKTYVDKNTPSKSQNYWSFGNKRLVKVALPTDSTDVTTVEYVNRNCLCVGKTGFDARNEAITNVGRPKSLDDVVSKRYLKDVLADLGYSVYASLHKGRAKLVPVDQWKSKVLDSSWEELFK